MALIPLIVSGCATARSVPEPGTGRITTRLGRPGAVVAAPHGTSDARTGEMAADIAKRTGFGLVVASGFSLDVREGVTRRYQVNRPSEGGPARPASEERVTEAAREVYESYERRVLEVAQGPLRFYVEIHGNGREQASERIEIASVGIDVDYAARLRTLLELIRDAHLRGERGAPRLRVLVEPADIVLFSASGAKQEGILRRPERGLHIELPASARVEWRALYTEILAEFLAEALRLPAPR